MARLCLIVLVAMLAGPLAMPTWAADYASEPVERSKNPLKRCGYLNNIWLWGDPTDCPGDETVPACDASNVVTAAKRFVERAEPVYREPDIAEIFHIREMPETVFNPSPLVRRYCRADVRLTNGDHTKAYYFIEEDSGFVGLSWKVYVCISGYDRWRVYDGRCRVARPAPDR